MALMQPSPTIRRIIEQTAQAYDVPATLALGVAYIESRFSPTARSPAGAEGLFQLMPQTAKALGVTDPTDPRQSARGGIRFLAALRKKWGSWPAALAAYNWGPGNLGRALEAGRSWPESVDQRYVRPVLAKAAEYAAALGLPDPIGGELGDTSEPKGGTPPPGPTPAGGRALVAVAAVLSLLWLLNRQRGGNV